MRPQFCLLLSFAAVSAAVSLTGCEQVTDAGAAIAGQGTADTDEASPALGLDTMVPYPLNQVVDIDMQDVPISDLAKWIHEEFDVPVEIIDEDDEWSEQARFDVRGEQQRLYTILNRALQTEVTGDYLRVHCVVRDGQVVFGDESYMWDQMHVVNYDVSDLLDRGFDLQALKDFLQSFTSGEWVDLDGIGGDLEHIRGVLIVRQTDLTHEEIAYLLAVLRQPREPVVRLHDLEDNRQCRLRLQEPVTLSLSAIPFDQAISHLGKTIGAPMRVNSEHFADEGYETDVPVSLEADAMVAADALDVLLSSYSEALGEDDDELLQPYIDDGEIVITTSSTCCDRFESRLYDVPYFSQTPEMQAAFIKLLMNYTSGEWVDLDGIGGEITVIQPGWIAIRQTNSIFDEIDELLPQWREAGLTDAARDRFPAPDVEPDPLARPYTAAYVMHVETATDLLEVLPERVSPGTWQDGDHPAAIGKIRMVRLGIVDFTPKPSVESADESGAVEEVAASDNEEDSPIQFPAAMLIIEHQSDILADVRSEIDDIRAESWKTDGGEIRPHTPIERVPFGDATYAGGYGFFQIP